MRTPKTTIAGKDREEGEEGVNNCFSFSPWDLQLHHVVILLLVQISLSFVYLFFIGMHCAEEPLSLEALNQVMSKLGEGGTENSNKGERETAIPLLRGSNGGGGEIKIGRTRYDKKRVIRIYDFYHMGEKWEDFVENRYHVCVAIHSTIERIHWLPQQLSKWSGPLSIALYIRTDEEWVILQGFLRYMEQCHSEGWSRTSMHLAFPAAMTPATFNLSIFDSRIEQQVPLACVFLNPEEYLTRLQLMNPITKPEKLALKEMYPQNHIRNIARKACGRDWMITLDIDILLKGGSADALEEFYLSRQTKNLKDKKDAFVIPIFELKESKPFPRSKTELLKCFQEGSARPYHGLHYPILQKPSRYQRWRFTNVKEGPIKISHPIESNRTKYYEPFYIASDKVPPFEERLMGYGATRTAQFFESVVAGWNFSVLTPIFAIHWSFLSRETLLSPRKDGTGENVRTNQTKANVQLFHRFMKEWALKKELGIL